MTLDHVLEHFGNMNRVARALGISRQAVWKWQRSGRVPLRAQYQIEIITARQLKADPSVSLREKKRGPMPRGRTDYGPYTSSSAFLPSRVDFRALKSR